MNEPIVLPDLQKPLSLAATRAEHGLQLWRGWRFGQVRNENRRVAVRELDHGCDFFARDASGGTHEAVVTDFHEAGR